MQISTPLCQLRKALRGVGKGLFFVDFAEQLGMKKFQMKFLNENFRCIKTGSVL